jgi:hypothetical protein
MRSRYALAGLLSVFAVLAIVALASAAGGRDEPAAASLSPASSAAALPPQRTRNLTKAARLARCTVARRPNEGAEHVTRELTHADYGTNPPTSGPHSPEWAEDGIYRPGRTPDLGLLVHTLEHGRINVQYRPGTPRTTIRRLKAFYQESDRGHHMLVYENATGMPFAVAATAWDRVLGCPKMNDRVFDALRAFRVAYIDEGPEIVP